jgi:peptide-methionine (R)-S-oxide reductase
MDYGKRDFLQLLGAGTVVAMAGASSIMTGANEAVAGMVLKLKLTDAEWRKRLSASRYRILREEGTEPAHSSPLDKEKRSGTFHCAGCDLALFDSSTKFDSRTGWPSFFQPISGHVETKTDFKLIFPRKEYHCTRCGGHQGHVFKDGPKPTGLRYCNNGLALTFKPKTA